MGRRIALLAIVGAVGAAAQQVKLCGNVAGASSDCTPVTSGGLFGAIFPFTALPFLILFFLSLYMCLKENDFDLDWLTNCCRCDSGRARRAREEEERHRAAALVPRMADPPVVTVVSTSPTDATSNPTATGITPANAAAIRRTSSRNISPAASGPRPGSADPSEKRSISVPATGVELTNAGPSSGPSSPASPSASTTGGAAAAAAERRGSSVTPAGGRSPAAGGKGKEWVCATCTYSNKAGAAKCVMCDAKRPPKSHH